MSIFFSFILLFEEFARKRRKKIPTSYTTHEISINYKTIPRCLVGKKCFWSFHNCPIQSLLLFQSLSQLIITALCVLWCKNKTRIFFASMCRNKKKPHTKWIPVKKAAKITGKSNGSWRMHNLKFLVVLENLELAFKEFF